MTGESQSSRYNQLEMCYSMFTYIFICETQVHSCLGSAISGIPHNNFEKSFVTHIFTPFLTKHITCPIFIVLQWDFHHLNAEFFYLTNWHYSYFKHYKTVTSEVNTTKNVSILDKINKHVHVININRELHLHISNK